MSANQSEGGAEVGSNHEHGVGSEERAHKRVKLDNADSTEHQQAECTEMAQNELPAVEEPRERIHGVASIKKEFLIDVRHIDPAADQADDDAAEAAGKSEHNPSGERGGRRDNGRGKGKNKDKGKGKDKRGGGAQNHSRKFGFVHDEIRLCKSRVQAQEFDPVTCSFGDSCKSTHDIREYLKNGKRPDLDTFEKCPVFAARGWCSTGWKCRFVGSHSEEVMHENGKPELRLLAEKNEVNGRSLDDEARDGTIKNVVPAADKILLRKKKFPMEDAELYNTWLDKRIQLEARLDQLHKRVTDIPISKEDVRAQFVEAPLRPSEKRRIYYGPETPVLAPLTTQGNLPFRRLCVSLGAEITWSEMAMSLELLRGENSEWALMKAHESEIAAPKFAPQHTVIDYDNSKDLRFGVQIAASKPWMALKATDVLTRLAPNIRAIDLNCGCPIDMVYKQGAGSALLDSHPKLERILRGMNVVSREVPITVKIRMGTVDKKPTADKLCKRLVLGAEGSDDGPAGVAAITLHGRSRQQRYTRSADWEYIASCAALVKSLQTEQADVIDTVREPDARDIPVTNGRAGPGLPYFIGNGDILSHVDWNEHMEKGNVDCCMIGRGALIKPWIFEEIAQNQYLDKSGSERFELVRQFVRNGLEYWGSDELGVATTRRFLLEWLSFSCRYVPVGILEHLPPKLGERPPAFKGRDDRETLLSSANYKDWIKISEQFLGPPTKDFHFEPKHKSNSYEIETQG